MREADEKQREGTRLKHAVDGVQAAAEAVVDGAVGMTVHEAVNETGNEAALRRPEQSDPHGNPCNEKTQLGPQGPVGAKQELENPSQTLPQRHGGQRNRAFPGPKAGKAILTTGTPGPRNPR